jgi:hypothetical protein
VPRRTKPILVKSLKKYISLCYGARGVKVITALVDREFEPLRDDLPEITFNTVAADERVTYVERQIRVIKERAREIRSTLPFKRLPARMIIELIGFVTLWLNTFPPKIGVYLN